jgi:hypothetical protein
MVGDPPATLDNAALRHFFWTLLDIGDHASVLQAVRNVATGGCRRTCDRAGKTGKIVPELAAIFPLPEAQAK